MKVLSPDEVLQPASEKLLPPFATSSPSDILSPGSDELTSPLKNLSELIKELLPRPRMFPAEKCLMPSGDVLLPSFDQPIIDEVLYPEAQDLLPLVDRLLPPSEELLPRPDLEQKGASR